MSSAVEFTKLIVPNGGINETVSPQQIKPNQWSAARNVEPLFDGVRRRNGSTLSNSVAIQAIGESHEAGTADREFHNSGSLHMSQGFQDAAILAVRRVAVRLKAQGTAGSITGTVNCAIFTNDGTGPPSKPNVVVSGLDTTDFNSLDPTTLTSEYKWYFFTTSAAVNLTAATTYHVIISHTSAAGTGTNNVLIEEDSGDTYPTETGYRSGDKAAWTATSADLNFRIYSGTEDITMIADYKLADTATQYHLVAAGGELYRNSSGTMTALSGRERQILTSGQNVFQSWGVMNDRFAFTNDNEVGKLFYDLSGTTYYENEGIAAPTATPVFTHPAGTSGFSAGEWQVDYYYWNDDIGVASDRRYGGVSALSATIASGDDIQIDSLPADVVRVGDRATHIRIELKSVADGQTIFRYVKQVTLGTTSVTIDETDLPTGVPTGVEAEYEHAVAPVHKIKCVAENRQFIANVAGAPYRLQYSPIIGTTPHYHSFPALNVRDFGKGDGDYITALFFVPPRMLVVGMKNSIRAIDARRPGTSDVVTISNQIGVAGHLSGKVIGRKLFFISDADENKGPFVWDGSGEPKMILGIDDTYKTLNAPRMEYASCAHLAPGDTRFQWWVLCSSNASTHDRILVYDYVLNAWTVYTKTSANVLGHIEEASVGKIYLGGNSGNELLQDSGSDDAGTAYDAFFTMQVMDFGTASVKKRFRWLDYIVSAQTTGGIQMHATVDYGRQNDVQAAMNQIFISGSPTWDSGGATWNKANTWGGGTDAWSRVRLCGRGFTFEPTLSFAQTKTSTETFHLKGIAFGFQQLRNKVAV